MGTRQAQYAPSMYIGLWSRIAGFRRDALTEALHRREVVQATLMRVTIHLCSREDFWPLVAPLRDARRTLWLRTRRGITEQAMAAGAEALRAALANGPLKRREIDALVGKEIAPGVGLWVDLVRVPPSGTWERRRADLYGLADDWLAPRTDPDPGDALDHLVSRYLTGFGPAAKADIAIWAGLTAKEVEPALGRLSLNRFTAEDGTELLDLPGAPLRTPTRPPRCASCRRGTPSCSPTRAARRCCPSSTAPRSSTQRCRSRSGPSSSTAPWPGPGGRTERSSPSRTSAQRNARRSRRRGVG